MAALCPGSRGLATGLFAVPAPLPPSVLARMAGLKAMIDPLAVGSTAQELVDAAAALQVDIPHMSVDAAAVLPVDIPDMAARVTPDAGAGGGDGARGAGAAAPVPVCLFHECVARNPGRVPTNDLYEDVGQVVGRTRPILPATSSTRISNPEFSS